MASIKVIDYALTDASPISPKKGSFYIGALLIGLLIPFLILYISFLLDDKLHTKEDILKLTRNKVILSEVPHIDSDDRITSSNDRSLLGESFRILRTNLTYIFDQIYLCDKYTSKVSTIFLILLFIYSFI